MAETDPSKYPGFTGETFPQAFTVPPPQPSVKKPGQLPPEKVQEYFDNVNIDLFISVLSYQLVSYSKSHKYSVNPTEVKDILFLTP